LRDHKLANNEKQNLSTNNKQSPHLSTFNNTLRHIRDRPKREYPLSGCGEYEAEDELYAGGYWSAREGKEGRDLRWKNTNTNENENENAAKCIMNLITKIKTNFRQPLFSLNHGVHRLPPNDKNKSKAASHVSAPSSRHPSSKKKKKQMRPTPTPNAPNAKHA
jgi:hypothetical protein